MTQSPIIFVDIRNTPESVGPSSAAITSNNDGAACEDLDNKIAFVASTSTVRNGHLCSALLRLLASMNENGFEWEDSFGLQRPNLMICSFVPVESPRLLKRLTREEEFSHQSSVLPFYRCAYYGGEERLVVRLPDGGADSTRIPNFEFCSRFSRPMNRSNLGAVLVT